jgi:hypothetical protein
MLYLLFLIVLTTSCASKKLENTVKAYQEAHNNHDIEKEMSLFADDIIYDVVGEWSVEGKEKLRKLAETDVEVNSNLTFTDIKVGENKVTCKVVERNDWLKIIGIDALYCDSGQFIFEKGLIKEVKLKRSQESIDAMNKFRRSFGQWASDNRSEELSKLKGSAVLAKEEMGLFMALLRDWREAMEEAEKATKEGEPNE